MRALIVTADDVGLHAGMTAGALKAHDEGIVTAVSVVANGRAFEEAVDLLKDRPGLDVGIHFTLVGERPLSRPERVRSLMDGNVAFLPDFRMFTRRYLLAGIAPGEVEEELRRQVERLAGTGLPIVHANSHQHLHVLPKIFETVLKIAEEHRIPFVRVPNEPALFRRPSPRALQIGILNGIGKTARRRLEDGGSAIRATDQTVGVMDAGGLNPAKLTQILDDVEGLAELVCHPGLGNEALAAAYHWGYGWERETEALCDAGVRETLRGKGIELTSFRQATPVP